MQTSDRSNTTLSVVCESLTMKDFVFFFFGNLAKCLVIDMLSIFGVSNVYIIAIETVSDTGVLHVLKHLCCKGLMNSLISQGLENSLC